MNRLPHITGIAGLALVVSSCTPAATEQAAATAPVVDAPAATGIAGSEDVEKTISDLEREWVAAIVQKDTATIDRLLADDFVGTSPTAHTYNKSRALAELTAGVYVVESMELDEIAVNSYGDMAIAFTSQQENSRYGNENLSGHYHFTNVWLKKDGRWQVVSSHGTRYGESHP